MNCNKFKEKLRKTRSLLLICQVSYIKLGTKYELIRTLANIFDW